MDRRSFLQSAAASAAWLTSGNVNKASVRFANEINSYRVGLTYFDVNFGSILIDWDADEPGVRCQVRDETGGVMLQQRLTLGRLGSPARK